jgi:uncharacterized damage-inducible protein DinB
MELKIAAENVLIQLEDVVLNIKDEDFSKPVNSLNGATIGQHIRHTLEFFTCLTNTLDSGEVCYDKRDHDKQIEEKKEVAGRVILEVRNRINEIDQETPLILHVGYDHDSDKMIAIQTNYLRELAYNIEHAIHHMAIIKIGINEVCPYIMLPEGFGVASSTIRHLKNQQVG